MLHQLLVVQMNLILFLDTTSDMIWVSYMDVDEYKGFFFQKWSLVSINVLRRSATLQVCFVTAKTRSRHGRRCVLYAWNGETLSQRSSGGWESKPALFAVCSTWMDSVIHTAGESKRNESISMQLTWPSAQLGHSIILWVRIHGETNNLKHSNRIFFWFKCLSTKSKIDIL